jgi:DNA modification methylase
MDGLKTATMGDATFYTGDCRQVMASLPAGSVSMCVTSPPYYGLRDYGIPSSVWGGETGCSHEWETLDERHLRGKTKSAAQRRNVGSDVTAIESGAFCHLCHAWLGTLGLEPTPELFIEHMVEVFRAVWRVLRPDGTLWLNLGDSYSSGGRTSGVNDSLRKASVNTVRPPVLANVKPKDLMMMPARVALALQADGWYLRSDIIWHKPNPMPESVTDRPTTSHEHIFLLAKSQRYYYDADAIREAVSPATVSRLEQDVAHQEGSWRGNGGMKQNGTMKAVGDTSGRNKRSVWTIPTQPYPEAHFATYPEDLIRPCILAGSPRDGVVLDPFGGAGTTSLVARQEGRRSIYIELKEEYAELAMRRLELQTPRMVGV